MDMRRYNETISCFCVVLILLGMAWSTEGKVLCISLGHTSMEPARENKCVGVGERFVRLSQEVALAQADCQTECGPCFDLPVNDDSIVSLQRVHGSGRGHAFEFFSAMSSSAPGFHEKSLLFSAMARPGYSDSVKASLSTSVLRI
ncbi:MAG TPA: hypothetical protein PKZ01_06280 [Candidatus Hydrogenedentes bacterium]|nr:hypothetical protein [Candidatus Hydrogenedentota bacterium]